jgi:hypothetical protein
MSITIVQMIMIKAQVRVSSVKLCTVLLCCVCHCVLLCCVLCGVSRWNGDVIG